MVSGCGSAVGVAEAAGAVVLLTSPRWSGVAALGLGAIMVGAITTSLVVPLPSIAGVAAAICLGGLAAVAWLRRSETLELVRRVTFRD